MEIEKKIEQTILNPSLSELEIENILANSTAFNFRAVVVFPCHIELAKRYFNDTRTKVVTVIDFPFGMGLLPNRLGEVISAEYKEADEIDLVCAYHHLLDYNFEDFKTDLETIKEHIEVPIKLILEADALSWKMMYEAIRIASDLGYMLKTKTGKFPIVKYNNLDIVRFCKEVRPATFVKAAGGIQSRTDAEELLKHCDSIGTSRGIEISQGVTNEYT